MLTTTQTKKYRSGNSDCVDNPYLNKAILDQLSELCADRLEELLNKLNIDYTHNKKYLVGPCPVHCGDNNTAFNVFIEGYSARSNWACYTHNCHRPVNQGGYGNTIFGLVRGVLSNTLNKKVTWKDAVDYVCKFLKVDINNIEIDPMDAIKKQSYAQALVLNQEVKLNKLNVSKEQVRKSLIYPAKYYVDRGFSEEILDKFDVGYCNNPSKPFYERCVFPVYDSDGIGIVGFSARTIHEQCSKCSLYHHKSKECPKTREEKDRCGKWLHSKGFSAHKYLFNYWNSLESIKKDRYAILVEGCGDCIKLEQLNVKNSLGLFGSHISEQQIMLLEMSGAMTLVVMTDNDEAGRKAAEQIKSSLGRLYRLYFPKFSEKDPGNLNKSQVSSDIEPILNSIKERI